MSNKLKEYVCSALTVFQNAKIPASKILLHKFIYFVSIKENTGFRFQPYTYGPFSFDLAETVNDMLFWKEIKEEKNQLSILKETNPNAEILTYLQDEFKVFCQLIDDDFSFDKLELIGTTLYCMNVLKSYNETLEKASVIKEFKDWKNNRYDETKIVEAFNAVQEHHIFE